MARITYYGHSVIWLEVAGYRLLFDPFITGNPLCPVQPEALHPDYILLTHAHGDHWGDTIAIARRTGAMVIGIWEIYDYLQKQGISNAHPMNLGGRRQFPFGRLTMTIAHHSSSFPDGTYGGHPAGFLLESEGKIFYNAGDTALSYEMRLLGERYRIDVAFLPVGDNFTMGPEDALIAAEWLKPRLVVPIHYNTFPVIEVDIEAFAQQLREKGIEVRPLRPGEGFTL